MSTIYAYDNSDFALTVIHTNSLGTAINITGHTSVIKVTKFYGSSVVVSIPGVIQTPASSGTMKYSATALQLSVLEYGTNVYTRYLYDSLGNTVSVVNGSFILIPTVV